jgi:pimeloyl-ACP methyl ester carboxylesterase
VIVRKFRGIVSVMAFRRLRWWSCWLALLLLSGCMFHRLGRDLEQAREHAVLRGSVRIEHPSDLPILVLVYTGEVGRERLVDYFVMTGPGRYYFVVPAGTYRLAAFVDINRDFTYQPGVDPSALLHAGEPVRVLGAATRDDLDIEVRDASRELIPFAFSSADGEGLAEGPQSDLRFVGTMTRIDDPRFSDENARRGLWQPVEFVRQVGAGVYFLEPYDPNKIPVLFVHGALGHPGDWDAIVAALDRGRFQPWLAYYPTATRLDTTTMALDRWMKQLYVRHRHRRLAVVAHSMGGLIARAFINRVVAAGDGRAVGLRLFVSVSTPWDGSTLAQLAVDRSPVVAPSWYDVAPGSPFLRSLLEPELPPTVAYDVLYSYSGNSRLMYSEPNDGSVTVASQLLPRGLARARIVRGFAESHTSILDNLRVAELVNERLETVVGE